MLGLELHLLLILPGTRAGGAGEEREPGPHCLLEADAAGSTAVRTHLCPTAEGAPWLMGHIMHDCKETCPTVLAMNCSSPSVCMH